MRICTPKDKAPEAKPGSRTFSIPAPGSPAHQYEIDIPHHLMEDIRSKLALGIDLRALAGIRALIGCGLYDAVAIASALKLEA